MRTPAAVRWAENMTFKLKSGITLHRRKKVQATVRRQRKKDKFDMPSYISNFIEIVAVFKVCKK